MQTTQQQFHPFFGHVIDGCLVKCDNGETLTVRSTIKGWVLVKNGVRINDPTNDCWVLTGDIIRFGR